MRDSKVFHMVAIALVAAILCILAPVSITLGFTPLPITLGMFAVMMAGILLGRRSGTVCVLLYILLGAVGLPVFSNFTGGLPKIAGPSGGYIWGYLFLVWITGFFADTYKGKKSSCALGALIGTVICYAFGTIWMALQLDLTPMEALWAGVIPFIPFDLVKIAVAVIACCPVRRILIQQNLLPEDRKLAGKNGR